MKPKALAATRQRNRSQVDMSQYSGGDASLRNLRKSFGAKRQAASDTAAGVEARQEARVATQTAAEEAIEKLAASVEGAAEEDAPAADETK